MEVTMWIMKGLFNYAFDMSCKFTAAQTAIMWSLLEKKSPRMDAIFNYRHLRAHNTAENMFGILSARCQASQMKPEKAD